MSTGFRMPPTHGNVLIGIQESFQPKFLPTAKKLHELGYNVSQDGWSSFIISHDEQSKSGISSINNVIVFDCPKNVVCTKSFPLN